MISSSGSHSLYELTGQLTSAALDKNRTERRTVLLHDHCRRKSEDNEQQARTMTSVLSDKHITYYFFKLLQYHHHHHPF